MKGVNLITLSHIIRAFVIGLRALIYQVHKKSLINFDNGRYQTLREVFLMRHRHIEIAGTKMHEVI